MHEWQECESCGAAPDRRAKVSYGPFMQGILGQSVADRLAGSGQRHLEREKRPALCTALTVMTSGDPRGLVAQTMLAKAPMLPREGS